MKKVAGSANTVLVGLVLLLFVALIGISIFTYMRQATEDSGTKLAADIEQLSKIFETIELNCDILGFDYQKNPINFLTIKKDGFVGSEVGSMNLAHPKKWQGPYVQDNPSIQGIEYQIVRTVYGHFITPGDGVMLPNGKQIGKDIVLDENSDIASMTKDESLLRYQGKALAAPVHIRLSPAELIPFIDEEVVQAKPHDAGVRVAMK